MNFFCEFQNKIFSIYLFLNVYRLYNIYTIYPVPFILNPKIDAPKTVAQKNIVCKPNKKCTR